MRLNNTIILVGLVSFCEISCGGSSSKNVKSDAMEAGETKTSEAAYVKGENKCLLDYSEKLDNLLTLEQAANLAGLQAGTAKTKYSKVMKNSAYHSVKYAWESDRKKDMSDVGIDMVVPVKNQIELHGLKEGTLKSFKMTYRVPTAEELKQRDKAVNDALDGKSGNKEVNEKLETLDKMKVDKATQKGVAQNLGNMFAKVAMAYEDVAGIGDAASWNSFERRLYVLDRGVETSISVDLSDDNSINKEKAIEIMKNILAVCN
jgi:hypothetical protein